MNKKLSLVIPAHNEEGCIENTVRTLHNHLKKEEIPHEILVINDHSLDKTEYILRRLQHEIPEVRYLNNDYSKGYGSTLSFGLKNFTGDYVATVMGDSAIRLNRKMGGTI